MLLLQQATEEYGIINVALRVAVVKPSSCHECAAGDECRVPHEARSTKHEARSTKHEAQREAPEAARLPANLPPILQ